MFSQSVGFGVFLVDMNYLRLILWGLGLAYLVFLAETVGIIVGLYVSLLVASFFILMMPVLAVFFTFLSFFVQRERFKKIVMRLFAVWVFLLLLNIVTLFFFPVIYTKSRVTMFMYHLLLVPAAGFVPVAVTGGVMLYHWFVAHYSQRTWTTMLLVFAGFVVCVICFYFFMRSPYFAQFIISLNSHKLNY